MMYEKQKIISEYDFSLSSKDIIASNVEEISNFKYSKFVGTPYLFGTLEYYQKAVYSDCEVMKARVEVLTGKRTYTQELILFRRGTADKSIKIYRGNSFQGETSKVLGIADKEEILFGVLE